MFVAFGVLAGFIAGYVFAMPEKRHTEIKTLDNAAIALRFMEKNKK